jgi:ABC-type multidrug transport system ATPase subunit
MQKVLLMDEISTGLDSATTYTVTEFLRTTTHYLHLTTLVSLLQPPPEVFFLFDDVILLSDGCAAVRQDSLTTIIRSTISQRNIVTLNGIPWATASLP